MAPQLLGERSIPFLGGMSCCSRGIATSCIFTRRAVVWFRFPLFAMAVVFWLGRDRRFVYAMLASISAGMLVMCAINAAEMVLLGQVNGRLSWPW